MLGFGEPKPSSTPTSDGKLTQEQQVPMSPDLVATKSPLEHATDENLLPNTTEAEKALQPFPAPEEKARLDSQVDTSKIQEVATADDSVDWSQLNETPVAKTASQFSTESPSLSAAEALADSESDPDIAKLKETLDAAIQKEESGIGEVKKIIEAAEKELLNRNDVLNTLKLARDSIPGVKALKQLGHITFTPPNQTDSFTAYTKFDAGKTAANPALSQTEQAPDMGIGAPATTPTTSADPTKTV